MKYEYRRACKCGNVDFIEVNRREAAFNLRNEEIWNMVCSKCGGKKATTLFYPELELTKDLLLEWGNDSELFFMEQDEDLMLADEKYVDLIFDVIDNNEILLDKRNLLIEAMCVIIYDCLKALEKENEQKKIQSLKKLKDKVKQELKQRELYVIEAAGWIMNYIKVVVFPELEIE